MVTDKDTFRIMKCSEVKASLHFCTLPFKEKMPINMNDNIKHQCSKHLTPEAVYKTINFPQKMLKKQLTNKCGCDIICKLSAEMRKDVEKSIKKFSKKLSKKY